MPRLATDRAGDAPALTPARPVCRHCHNGAVNRPRGLCWSCYYTDGVRDLYPPTSKYARRGVGNFVGLGRMPEPTSTIPGTPERLEVLAGRAARGERLWHPDDATGVAPGDHSPIVGPRDEVRVYRVHQAGDAA